MMKEYYATTHYNWEWFVHLAIKSISEGDDVLHLHNTSSIMEDKPQPLKFQELPSYKLAKIQYPDIKFKPLYSLFRIEVMLDKRLLCSVWAESQAFSILDSKESLFLHLKACHHHKLMPTTYLIPWDVETEEEILNSIASQSDHLDKIGDCQSLLVTSFHEIKIEDMILKSALGSGGSGIYFLNSMIDIVELVKNHATRAKQFDGFLQNIRHNNHGRIPSWSLQKLIQPIQLIENGYKTQVRVYIIRCKGLLVCNQYEVRVPVWDVEDDMGTHTMNSTEIELVGQGKARPYNASRNKGETNRLLLDEVSELTGSRESISLVVHDLITSLQPVIDDYETKQKYLDLSIFPRCQMAIAAIDLIVEGKNEASDTSQDKYLRNGYRAYVLELNSNPAMPGKSKRMSVRYRQHIESFIYGLIKLGLSNGEDMSNGLFTTIA